MDNGNGLPRRKPVPRPSAQPLPENWAADLTQQFRRTLSTKRMNALSNRPASLRRCARRPTDVTAPPVESTMSSTTTHVQSPSPPHRSIQNLPTVPTAPVDQKSLRFRTLLMSLSNTPCKWENPGLLDEALGVIPLQRIYEEAQEEADLFIAQAASMGTDVRPAWGYQDCVVRALMKWFKREFFVWINNPRCSTCRSPTIAQGMAAPLPDESARGANRVELYMCSNQHCMSYERFPRYNDAFVLLQTRRGRVGEWANCFSMLCRAVGSRVRWVWNAEDHVWTEIYSVHRKRWVHVDCCEEQWDAPMLYTKGWGKKLSYCIAFSADGCVDVTRRYVRTADDAVARNKCSEGVLTHILREISALRRRDMDKKERFRLNAEEMREDGELRKGIIEALAYNISQILPGSTDGSGNPDTQARGPLSDPDALKAREAAEARQSGNAEWVRRRGEARSNRSQDRHPQ